MSSEAAGQLVIKSTEEITAELASDKSYVPVEAITKLVEYAGLDTKGLQNLNYGIQDLRTSEDCIMFTIFDSDWMKFSHGLCGNANNIELYAYLSDDYGTNIQCALNTKGERFAHVFEFEGDEWHQEDFNEEEYLYELSKKKKKWKSMIPAKIKKMFPELIKDYS